MVALRTIGKFSSGFVQLISTNLNVLLLGFLQNSILGLRNRLNADLYGKDLKVIIHFLKTIK